MLIVWLTGFIFLGLLLAWQPALWGVGVFQLGILAVSAVALVLKARAKMAISAAPDVVAICLLACWGPAQIALHRSAYNFDTWNATVQWLTVCASYLIARSLLQSRESRQRFLSILIWAGTVLGIVSIILHFSAPDRLYGLFESRFSPYGPFVYKNQFAAFIELLIPIAFFRLITARQGRLGYAIVFAALFACSAASLSRAGFLIAAAEVLLLSGVSWYRRTITGASLLKFGLPVFLLMVIFTLVVGTDAITARFEETNVLAVRGPLAASTLQMIKHQPVSGFGLGTWRLVYPEFANFDVAVVANEAHNDWLQWASEGGIPFALILLGLAAWLSRLAWKHLWGLGVPAVFVHCLMDYPTRLPSLAALLFLMAGALAATAARKRTPVDSKGPEWSVLSVRTAVD